MINGAFATFLRHRLLITVSNNHEIFYQRIPIHQSRIVEQPYSIVGGTMIKRAYYPKTTVEQRVLLFAEWEASGDVNQACATAHVSRSTYYYWRDRFIEHGYAGLTDDHRSLPPTNTLPDNLTEEIVNLKKGNPTWGKWQIARIMTERHPERSPISPNTVRRVLTAAGFWW
jgi:transposase